MGDEAKTRNDFDNETMEEKMKTGLFKSWAVVYLESGPTLDTKKDFSPAARNDM